MRDLAPADRVAAYARVSTALSLFSDGQLAALVDAAPVLGNGIGGTAVRLEVEGTPVFAKRVALTDLERRPEHLRSTANVFDLPAFCHYGLGSAGGGVWREVAAHVMTTGWVLDGSCGNFPMLYHWRVLPGAPPVASDAEARDERVDFWGGSVAVARRLEAIADATAGVVLFCEYFPQTVGDWLTKQLAAGESEFAAACELVEAELRTGATFMSDRGLLHFDAHFDNIVTDGRGLYFTDFGLASSSRFDLSPAETEFVDRHRLHDFAYTMTELVNWLVREVIGVPEWAERIEYLRRGGHGGEPAAVAAIIERYRPLAVLMNEFYWRLFHEARTTPFPAEEVQRLVALTLAGR